MDKIAVNARFYSMHYGIYVADGKVVRGLMFVSVRMVGHRLTVMLLSASWSWLHFAEGVIRWHVCTGSNSLPMHYHAANEGNASSAIEACVIISDRCTNAMFKLAQESSRRKTRTE